MTETTARKFAKEYFDGLKIIHQVKFSDLAQATGKSPQSFHNKRRNGTLTVWELVMIADSLDADVKLIDRNTGDALL